MADDQSAVEHFVSAPGADRNIHQSIVFTKASCSMARDPALDTVKMVSLCMGYQYQKLAHFHLQIQGPNGERHQPLMGTCGLGIQRIFIALFDHCRDDFGISFPRSVRPWDIVIIPLSSDMVANSEVVSDILQRSGLGGVVIDDRHSMSLGKRLKTADFYGVPVRLVIGPAETNCKTVNVRVRGRRLEEDLHVDLNDLPSVMMRMI